MEIGITRVKIKMEGWSNWGMGKEEFRRGK